MARAGRPFTAAKDRDRMGYEDFCVFFMASEDKTTAPALRYWFNVCDIDGDGVLTPRDLRWFYDDQARRMRDHGMEVVKFEDILCQLHDLLKPEAEGRLLLRDFVRPERIKLTGALFNALFDLDKFQRFEGREAKMVKQIENYAQSQWDAFAAVERVRAAGGERERARESARASERMRASQARPSKRASKRARASQARASKRASGRANRAHASAHASARCARHPFLAAGLHANAQTSEQASERRPGLRRADPSAPRPSRRRYQRLASEEEEVTSLVQGGGGARSWV